MRPRAERSQTAQVPPFFGLYEASAYKVTHTDSSSAQILLGVGEDLDEGFERLHGVEPARRAHDDFLGEQREQVSNTGSRIGSKRHVVRMCLVDLPAIA